MESHTSNASNFPPSATGPLRLAVIGAGAVVEHVHLPALRQCRGVRATALVDRRLDRASQLAAAFGVPHVSQDHRAIVEHADAAIVAVPNEWHASVAIDLLDAGLHVLVEKPMALSAADCDAMIAAAARNDRLLGVGLLRRFSDTLRFVKHALAADLLGPLTRFHLREGAVFKWPVTSDAMFRPGGGVLADAGAHALDLLLWWLGDCEITAAFDDQLGGTEAECRLELRTRDGATGVVELSRRREMSNSCLLVGTRGVLEVGTKTDSWLRLSIEGTDVAFAGCGSRPGGQPPRTLLDLSRPQLQDFADAILEGRPPAVPGSEGRRAIALIERAYALRQPLVLDWETIEAPRVVPG